MPIVTINSNNHNELDRWCPKFRIVVLDTISYYVEISRLKTCAYVPAVDTPRRRGTQRTGDMGLRGVHEQGDLGRGGVEVPGG